MKSKRGFALSLILMVAVLFLVAALIMVILYNLDKDNREYYNEKCPGGEVFVSTCHDIPFYAQGNCSTADLRPLCKLPGGREYRFDGLYNNTLGVFG